MTATSEVRFTADGPASVHSYIRLTASTHIHCSTYPDAAPILSIHDGPADITITNPGQGEATAEDVAFGRALADAVTQYVTELEKHATGPAQQDGQAA
jgi:hypothetical protein